MANSKGGTLGLMLRGSDNLLKYLKQQAVSEAAGSV